MRIVSLAQECLQYGTDCERMPTAILRYFTSAGFVLGADGKTFDPIKQETLSTDTQKIFQIPGFPAAYALYGDIGIGDDDPDTPVLLDLGLETKRLLSARAAMPADIQTFGSELAAGLQALLVEAKEKGAIFHGFDAFPYGTAIARILFLATSRAFRPRSTSCFRIRASPSTVR